MSRHGMEHRHLVQADRHIAKAKELIERQKAIVRERERAGEDVSRSQRLLDTLRESLGEFETHRQMIVEALQQPEG